jgi:hypothetical protein
VVVCVPLVDEGLRQLIQQIRARVLHQDLQVPGLALEVPNRQSVEELAIIEGEQLLDDLGEVLPREEL